MFVLAVDRILPKKKGIRLLRLVIIKNSFVMEMFNSTLKSEDVKFFYRVLYQYEKEGTGRHTGYSYKDVSLEIRKKFY